MSKGTASAMTYRFSVGSIDCVAVDDGGRPYPASLYFPDAPADELQAALQAHHLDPDGIPSPYTCLALNGGQGWVLLDTGGGDIFPTTGRLLAGLRAEGIAPEDVTLVVITHCHRDHIGANVDAEGNLSFPNARWVMWKDDWEHFTSEQTLSALSPAVATWFRARLMPLRDCLTLVDHEGEIAPGVWGLPAGGHSPGHMVVLIKSKGEELLYISDTVLHPIHLEHPEWQSALDMDRERAAASTRRVFDRAADGNSLVLAFHFPFPSLGHVVKRDVGWEWLPILVGNPRRPFGGE